MPIETGRYFTEQESEAGRNVALIGHRSATELFPNSDPIGKEIKIKGLKYYVVGTLEEEGDRFLGAPSNDDNIYLPLKAFTTIASV